MNNRNKSLGLALIFLGIIFLLENLDVFRFNFLQILPVIVILVGLGFLLGFLANRKYTPLLMPGVILLLYGALFLYCHIAGWEHIQSLWPILLISPGIGFVLLYFVDKHDKTMLWLAVILIVLGLLFSFRHVPYLQYWASFLFFLRNLYGETRINVRGTMNGCKVPLMFSSFI